MRPASSNPESPRHGIGEASARLGLHPRTLMAYERLGLVRPERRSNRREYSEDEIRWLGCVRELNRDGGISHQGLATMLRFVPCWAIRQEACGGVEDSVAPVRQSAEERMESERRAYEQPAPQYCRTCGMYRYNRVAGGSALAAITAGAR
jgi:MerR family transcriptional regulator/heat shock protein HspR